MKFIRLTFPNAEGHQLSARLDFPVDGKPKAYAIFAHCFTCNKNYKAVANISGALTRKGLAVLRFDFTGLGDSEGDFSDTNFSSNVADLVAAARFLSERYAPPELLLGHSFGGTASIQAALRIPSAAAVVTIGSPADPQHVRHLLGPAADRIQTAGEAEIALAGRPFRIRKQFLDDLDNTRIKEALRNLDRALLILHSPVDDTVGIENAAQLFQMARHPKSFVSLDRADHLLTDPSDSRYVGAFVAEWAAKYLSEADAAEPDRVSEGQVTARIGRAGYTTELRAGRHGLIADEPASVGGADSGPSPYDFLLAGLGACTVMTLRMYADRKGWPLDSATVHLSHEKIHAADCENCEAGAGMLDRIERMLEVAGDLSEDQKARLLEIADRCPVHRTLRSDVSIRTRLKSP